MKKKIGFGILLTVMILTVSIGSNYYKYKQIMKAVEIVHYITGSGSGYSTVYLTAVVAEGPCCREHTAEAIRRYVIFRNGEIPDVLQIVLYETMEKLQDGESCFKVIFR